MTDQIPPPQPPDSKTTRPPLNLDHMLSQVRSIQTALAEDRARKKNEATGKD